MQHQQRWLKCLGVFPGMFSDEKVVTIVGAGGLDESFFVPESEVRDEERLLRVQIMSCAEDTLVRLPTDHYTLMVVRNDQLVSE